MTEKERILRKLERVRALAERGVDGERENAERTLAALMARYGITEEELEDDRVETHWIAYRTEHERKLLHQLAYMYLGRGHTFGCVGRYTNRKRKKVGVECTAAVYIEIEADYEFYRQALAEEMDIFYSAFVQKNNLYPTPELAGDDEEEIDLVRAAKVAAMAAGIDHRTRHKALDGPKE